MTGARVLVLGGTAEGRRLATELAGDPRLAVVSSLAGRVRDPALPPGEVRIGGFGGVAGLARWLRAERIAAVVDATHPFAAGMTAHAAAATAATGVPLRVLRRPAWVAGAGDRWVPVGSLAAAAVALPALGARVFLTTGRGGLAPFAASDLWFLLRSVDPPSPPAPRRLEVVLDRGPFTVGSERTLLREHRVDVLVTRNSGGAMTGAKLDAARQAGLPVVMVDRPALPPGVTTVATVAAAASWVHAAVRAVREDDPGPVPEEGPT